jgi:hypothetical protein
MSLKVKINCILIIKAHYFTLNNRNLSLIKIIVKLFNDIKVKVSPWTLEQKKSEENCILVYYFVFYFL